MWPSEDAGLYYILADDIQKDEQAHTFQWTMITRKEHQVSCLPERKLVRIQAGILNTGEAPEEGAEPLMDIAALRPASRPSARTSSSETSWSTGSC